MAHPADQGGRVKNLTPKEQAAKDIRDVFERELRETQYQINANKTAFKKLAFEQTVLKRKRAIISARLRNCDILGITTKEAQHGSL